MPTERRITKRCTRSRGSGGFSSVSLFVPACKTLPLSDGQNSLTQELNTHFRLAERQHLAAVVALLADDPLGSTREAPDQQLDHCYVSAFEAIEADPNNELIIAENSGSIVGTLQITYAPNLTHMGSMRATIEGVRVSSTLRSSGIGTRMLHWAIERCRSRGCRLVQLTSDLTRDDAIAFYGGLGFKHTHAGLKLWL